MGLRLFIGTERGLFEGDGAGSLLGERRVTALAASDGDAFALVRGTEVWALPSGATPKRVAAISGPRGECVLPVHERILLGTESAHLVEIRHGEAARIESFDRAPGREEWYTPWGGPPATRSLGRGAEGNLYANVHVGGILRSADGGRTWEPTLDIDADVHRVFAHPNEERRVYAASARGVGVSADGGTSWRFHTAGLHASYLRAVVVAGDRMIVTASTGPSGGRAAVYRGSARGGPLKKCRGGLPGWFRGNIDSHCLAAEGESVAFGTADGRVYRSDDAGATWSLFREGLPPVTCVAVASAPG